MAKITLPDTSIWRVMRESFMEGFRLGIRTWWVYATCIPLGIIYGVLHGQ